MEEKLTTEEIQVHHLIEEKEFFNLTENEKKSVLNYISEHEYKERRAVIVASKNLFYIPEVNSFLVNKPRKQKALLMYWAIVSTAAAVVFMIYTMKQPISIIKEVEKKVYLTADTVYIEKEIIDTFYIYLKKEVKIVESKNLLPISSLNFSGLGSEPLPELSKVNISNRGQSIENDKTIALIEGKRL